MSLKLPIVSCNNMLKFLKKEGFIELRQSSSHKFLKHQNGKTIVLPIHNNKEIGKGLLKAMLNEINMPKEYFLKNFKN